MRARSRWLGLLLFSGFLVWIVARPSWREDARPSVPEPEASLAPRPAPELRGGDASDERRAVASTAQVFLAIEDDDGRPVSGARINLLSTDGATRAEHETDRLGRAAVEPGDYLVWIRGPRTQEAFGPCDLRANRTLRVPRPGEVTLRFLRGKEPVPGIRVALRREPSADELQLGLERASLKAAAFDATVPPDRLAARLEALRGSVSFGPLPGPEPPSAESHADGAITWSGLSPGSYRLQLLSEVRVDLDPPHELGLVGTRGRLPPQPVPRGLSGSFRVEPGSSRLIVEPVRAGTRVTGVVLVERARPAEGALVTLEEIGRSPGSTDLVLTPEERTRTDENGRFAFEGVSPGEKAVFAVLDRSGEGHVWVSTEEREFRLAEGEERDVGRVSMDGAVVEVRASFVDEEGRTVPPGEAVAEPDPCATLVLTNHVAQASGFSVSLPLRIGEPVTLHGLSPRTHLELASGRARSTGRRWSVKPPFLEDPEVVVRERFDPWVSPEVELRIPLQRTALGRLRLLSPSGSPACTGTTMQGMALRIRDRRRIPLSVACQDGRSFGGELRLPIGEYELFLGTSLPEEGPNVFARGRIRIPGEAELPVEKALMLTGTLVDARGHPARSRALRVSLADSPQQEGWTSIWSDESGHFVLGGIPPNSRLLFEAPNEALFLGGSDLRDVPLVLPDR